MFAISVASVAFSQSRETVTIVVVVVIAAAIGWAEDLRGVPIGARLLVHLACGLLMVTSLPPFGQGVIAGAGSVLLAVFVVSVINAVNFMDGIDGISATTGLVAGATYAAVGSSLDVVSISVLGAATSAACLAFLPWNLWRARVFLGDVGSYGLGAVLAGCVVVAIRNGATVEAAVAPVALYLCDTGTVISRRVLAREPWHLPHRSHVYQRLTDTGLSHVAVTTCVFACTVGISLLGFLSLTTDGVARVVIDLAAVLLLGGYLASAGLRSRRLIA